MLGRKGYKRFSGLRVAVLLLAGSGLGGAILLLAGRSPFLSSSPQTVRTGDQREAKPIAADLLTAVRNADVQVIRKLLDNGADVNARDAEGNTPLILASLYASTECVELRPGRREPNRLVRNWSSCCWQTAPTRMRQAVNRSARSGWRRRPRG